MHDGTYQFVRFNGATLVRHKGGFVPLTTDEVIRIGWREFPGMAATKARELQEIIGAIAPDRTADLEGFLATAINTTSPMVWDMRKAEWSETPPLDYVYQTSIVPNDRTAPVKRWLLELAQGDEDLAYDYIQALAPLMLHQKPAGVLWFVGDGSNGKSSLLKVIHKIFSPYLVSLTASAIEDGRDTPRLNGMLGNICTESSEARVEDSERYKAVGTHEPFTVHKFHSQDSVEVRPYCHTIFNSNNIPTFRDKTRGSRRRTLVVPFNAVFADDPEYDDRLMTPEFLGGFLTLLTEAATELHRRGLRYNWSEATLAAKQAYDDSVNSAESFIAHLSDIKAVGFTTYKMLMFHYESFCGARGLEPLRVGSVKRSLLAALPIRDYVFKNADGITTRAYTWVDNFEGVEWWDNGLATRTAVQLVPEQAELKGTW